MLGKQFVRGAQAADKALVNANALESVDLAEEAEPMTPGQVRSSLILYALSIWKSLFMICRVAASVISISFLAVLGCIDHTVCADEEQAEQAYSRCQKSCQH